MASLGDLFPDQFKKDYLSRSISPKALVIVNIPQFNLSYDKFIVLVMTSSDDEYMGCVSVNTNASFKNNHIIVTPSEHPCLSYNSHVDCNSLIPIKIKWLKEILGNDPTRIKGEITDSQHVEIIQKLKASPLLSNIEKRRFNL